MRLFSNLSKAAKIMFASATVICIVLLVLGLIAINLIDWFYDFRIEKNLPYVTGIMLGYVHSVIKLIMLEKSLNGIINTPEKEKAENIGRLLYMARFLFTGVVLAFAFIFPNICGPMGTVLGVLSLQISAYTANFFLIKSEKNDNAVSADANDEDSGNDGDGIKNIKKSIDDVNNKES